jgi:hypothetical protein
MVDGDRRRGRRSRAVKPEAISVHEPACSPEAITAGRLWTLATSGFIVAGPPIPQLIMTALVAIAIVRLAGPGIWWLSAIAGQVGATFLAYGGSRSSA